MTRIDLAATPELLELLFTHSQLDQLRQFGELHLHLEPDRFADEVADIDLDVVVTTWATPPVRHWARNGPPRLLAHTGGSVRPLLGDAGVPEGCQVVQAAGAMAEGVAEMALALCLLLLRKLHTFDRALQGGPGWAAVADEHGAELTSQRIGVVGASRTGRAFLAMLRGLGADRVRVCDPYISAAEAAALGGVRAELHELLTWSDVVVLHAPVTAETAGMIGASELALLRDGAIVVNTARAALVNQQALETEAVSGRLLWGLDVLHEEPLPSDSPLIGLENVCLTPHRAAATTQARERQGQTVVDETARFVSGEPLRHAITPESYHQLS